ncbi:MAG: SRPBCC family protein [bacterium]|nr:SRPBCC family protein [bacterium]
MIPFSIDPDIRKAFTVPSAWYRDRATYDQVLENVLLPSWQYVASEAEIQEASETVALPVNILPGSIDEPLVVVRDSKGTRILSNVCTHRGNILVRKACTLREIRCMYHGRRFNTEGKCIHMPEFKEVVGFPAATDNLRVIDHGTFANMHFARVAPLREAQPLPESGNGAGKGSDDGAATGLSFDSWAQILNDRLGFLPLENAVHIAEHDKDFTINAHWALYVENYLEGFHIPFVHPGLNAVLEWNSYETICLDNAVLQIGIARPNDLAFTLPTNHIDHGKHVAAYYYWMFPNIMINVYPWGISLNCILPQGIDKTLIRYRTFVWDPSTFNTGAGSALDTVEAEDDDVVEHVQRGIRSHIYDRGRYSPTREQGVHHFHRMLEVSLVDNRSNPRLKR